MKAEEIWCGTRRITNKSSKINREHGEGRSERGYMSPFMTYIETDDDDAAVLTRPRNLRYLNSQPINGMCDSVEDNCLRNTAAATVVSDLPRSSDLSTRDLSGSRVVPHPPVQVQREMLRQQIHQSLV